MLSLKPSDQQQGGLLDDADVLVKSLTWCPWDYNGKIQTPCLALCAELEHDENGEIKTDMQYFSAGDLSKFQPSADGKGVVAVGNARGLNENTNSALFLKSFVQQGFPEDKIGESVVVFEGTEVHVNRIKQPERKGANFKPKAEGERDNTVLVVTKINRLPWEGQTGGHKVATMPAKPATPRPAPAPAPAPATAPPPPPPNAPEAGADYSEEAAEVLVAALEANNGTIPVNRIAMKTLKILANHPHRAEILALLNNSDFLLLQAGWGFDGTNITSA